MVCISIILLSINDRLIKKDIILTHYVHKFQKSKYVNLFHYRILIIIILYCLDELLLYVKIQHCKKTKGNYFYSLHEIMNCHFSMHV